MKSNNCCRHIDDDNEAGKKVEEEGQEAGEGRGMRRGRDSLKEETGEEGIEAKNGGRSWERRWCLGARTKGETR